MILKNGSVLDDSFNFVKADVTIEKDKILSVGKSNDDGFDCSDCFVVPGLIDVHTHGAIGYDNSDSDPVAIQKIGDFMLKNGATGFLPTLITGSKENLIKASENIKNYDNSGAKALGIHMEGPYFSVKYKGAQNEKFLRNPSIEEFDEINQASGNEVSLISMAPELPGAMDFIKAVSKKCRVSMGHTDADYETAVLAIKNGATHMTHTFNAMRGIHHRNPNAIGAAIDSDIFMECISDGVHIHPSMVRMLYHTIGAKRLVLISDSLRATGMADGEYDLGGQTTYVKNGRATLSDGTIAGSNSTLFNCVKCANSFGIPLEDAIRCATINPARVCNKDKTHGSIKPGKFADILILDKDLNLIRVMKDGNWIK